MGKKKYQWKLDRLVGVSVVVLNLLMTVLMLLKMATTPDFIKVQLGLGLYFSPWQFLLFSLIMMGLVLLLNGLFLKKNYLSWMLIGFFQTLLTAFTLRNIFLIILYEESIALSLFQNIFVLIYMSGLTYLTLFSPHILTYFKLQKKK